MGNQTTNYISTRKAKTIAIVLVFFSVSCFIYILKSIGKDFGIESFTRLGNIFSVLVIIFVIILTIIKLRHKKLRDIIWEQKIINKLEDSLISCKIFEKRTERIVLVPKIKVDSKHQLIYITIFNMHIFARLQDNVEFIQSALPPELEIVSISFSQQQKVMIIDYFDLREDKRFTFNTPEEFSKKVESLPYSTLLLDRKNNIDLKRNPMTLVVGQTGSGKSFFTYTVIFQAIIKGWKVKIFDYKRSYQAFRSLCDVHFTVEEIRSSLKEAITELHERQSKMDTILEQDPTAVATENGFPLMLLVVEEYMALMSSGYDKKVLQEIEKMILEITVLGRALGIHIYLVMQVSSADTINTSIRANLTNKLVFGSTDSTILRTTFGINNTPKVNMKMEVGEGLGTFSIDTFTFKAPSFKFDISQMFPYLQRYVNH